MIELRIGNIFTDIIGDLPHDIYKEIEAKLSFKPMNFQYVPSYNKWIRDKTTGKLIRRGWDGIKYCCWKNSKRTYFPTGLFSLASQVLDEKKIPYNCLDLRIEPAKNIDIYKSETLQYRDYQKSIIDTACDITRGLIQLPTGAGKTLCAAGIIEQLKVSPFLFFVTSIDLLTQAKNCFQEVLRQSGSNIKVGQIGGGIVDIADINVMTVQTAVRALGKAWDKDTKFDDDDVDDNTDILDQKKEIVDLIRSAKGSISDECQHWRASTCQLIAREMKSVYYTYGLSATPFRDDGDDMLIQACFGKVIASISASELIRQKWLVPPHIRMLKIKQPPSKFKQWQSIYKDQVVENTYYNNLIASVANKFCENNRLVLILTQQIKHGREIAKNISGAVFLSGDSPKKQREEGLENLRKRKISCIVSTAIFDEGIDVRPLDTLILSGQGKSRVRAMQRVGRTMRPFTYEDGRVKTKSTVIDFSLVNQKYLKKHARERLKMYKEEPEFVIKEMEIEGM